MKLPEEEARNKIFDNNIYHLGFTIPIFTIENPELGAVYTDKNNLKMV